MQGNTVDTNVYTRPTKEMGIKGGGRLIDNDIMNYATLASKIDIDTVRSHPVQGKTRKRFRGKMRTRSLKHTWSLRIKTQRTIAAQHISYRWHLNSL